jgi:hypothetical protein
MWAYWLAWDDSDITLGYLNSASPASFKPVRLVASSAYPSILVQRAYLVTFLKGRPLKGFFCPVFCRPAFTLALLQHLLAT